MSRLLGGRPLSALKAAAQLPSSERGQTTTVDGIIIFKSCMGCIFSALSSASRPAEITPVSRRVYRDGTADQSHPPSKRPIFDRVWRNDNNKIVCTLATIMHVFFTSCKYLLGIRWFADMWKWEIITPLAEGQWKLFRQRVTLFRQRDNATRGRNNVARGRYNFHWPEGRGVIMTL